MDSSRLFSSVTEDEKLLIRHILDLAGQNNATGRSRASCFLDERQLALCTGALKSNGYTEYGCIGGYENAARKVIVFYGYGESVPFTPVVFTAKGVNKLTHRDFLGALMSENIKRETLGDILVGEKRTVVFVLNTVLPVIEGITKIGSCGVNLSYDFSERDIPEQEFEEIKATVQSLRLDAVLSSAVKASREKTQEFIKSKGVILNNAVSYSPDERMSEGDVFSVRGVGKFILDTVGGLSKKDRIFITIKKYK